MRHDRSVRILVLAGLAGVVLVVALAVWFGTFDDQPRRVATGERGAPPRASSRAEERFGRTGSVTPERAVVDAEPAQDAQPSGRRPVPVKDLGLEATLRALKDLDDPQSTIYRGAIIVSSLENRLQALGAEPISDAEYEELEKLDAPWRRKVAEVGLERTKLKLTMTVAAIQQGRCRELKIGKGRAAERVLTQRVQEITSRFKGPPGDYSWVSTGGPTVGTSRIVEFFRSEHPEYFLADEAVRRARRERDQHILEWLRSRGKVREDRAHSGRRK